MFYYFNNSDIPCIRFRSRCVNTSTVRNPTSSGCTVSIIECIVPSIPSDSCFSKLTHIHTKTPTTLNLESFIFNSINTFIISFLLVCFFHHHSQQARRSDRPNFNFFFFNYFCFHTYNSLVCVPAAPSIYSMCQLIIFLFIHVYQSGETTTTTISADKAQRFGDNYNFWPEKIKINKKRLS